MAEDYKDKLREDYEEILSKIKQGMLPHVARIPLIEKAVSDYVLAQDEHFESLKARGEFMPIQLRDSDLLSKVADLVFYEELTWSHPDKMTIVDYPIMSDWQAKERREKTIMPGEITHNDRQYNGRRKSHGIGKNGEIVVTNPKVVNEEDEGIAQTDKEIDVSYLLESSNLTDRQRQAIELVYFMGMTQEEAAEVMSVKKHTVNEHLTKSLRKMREKAELLSN